MEHSGFLTFFYRRFETTFSIGKDTTEYSFMLPAFHSIQLILFHPPYTTRGYVEDPRSPEPLLLEPGWLGVLAKGGRLLRRS